ncbi:hypothetical protein DFH08DRAFT_817774 [Mycena albidolilacea]|uniref:Uncharacterized protein n=1 Tax=Mycena albidolilacea TaxID=1033008 RepID=A0AAD7EHY6_9AGAR|nr:hypothetical protein DFH08DRAFT_817774 [Mycena albidolilacea]
MESPLLDVWLRRPLSALGVVHIFQRRALVRRWHEGFPTIHTEGGLPGSENAGIVAFIRERLVDLGEDPRGLAKDPKQRVPTPVSLLLEMVHGGGSANQGMQEDDHRQIHAFRICPGRDIPDRHVTKKRTVFKARAESPCREFCGQHLTNFDYSGSGLQAWLRDFCRDNYEHILFKQRGSCSCVWVHEDGVGSKLLPRIMIVEISSDFRSRIVATANRKDSESPAASASFKILDPDGAGMFAGKSGGHRIYRVFSILDEESNEVLWLQTVELQDLGIT